MLADLQAASGSVIPAAVIAPAPPAASAFWFPTASMLQPRIGHTATLLSDGRVLVMGGSSQIGPNFVTLSSAEYFDPGTQRWFSASSTFYARIGHTATRLQNGNVVVAGGTFPFNSTVEMYIPANNAWYATGRLNVARSNHTATLLNDGRILVAGGLDVNTTFLASAELYNPVTQTWTLTGSLATARWGHTATLLPNGKVLVVSGESAEIFDPATETWGPTDIPTTSRFGNSTTSMMDGRVLIAGGLISDSTHNFSLKKVEEFNPVTSAFFMVTNMNVARRYHGAALLPNGKVLVTGGTEDDLYSGGYQHLSSTEVFDPFNLTWTTFGGMSVGRLGQSTTTLLNGNVLVAGGSTDTDYAVASAELFDSTVTCSTITLGPAPMPGATLGTAYNVAMQQFGSAIDLRSWYVVGGALPPGLTLSTATGVVSGTPTATGTYHFIIQAVAGNCPSTATNETLVVGRRLVTFPIGSVGTTLSAAP